MLWTSCRPVLSSVRPFGPTRSTQAATTLTQGDGVGVYTRRFFYSEALVEHPEDVKPVFLSHLTGAKKVVTSLAWPRVRQRMIAMMDLGAAQGEDSRRILEGELDWLDGLLADGRPFLCGYQLTRADIAAASLLARTAGATDHPYYHLMKLPPRMTEVVAGWHDRPAMAWIREMYRNHR